MLGSILSYAVNLEEENRQLKRWKAEALEVLDGWEGVWEASKRPGTLGGLKSRAVLGEIQRLQDFNQRLMNELAQHGWGDMHYGPQEQDRNIVALLEEGGYQFERGSDASPTGGDRETR